MLGFGHTLPRPLCDKGGPQIVNGGDYPKLQTGVAPRWLFAAGRFDSCRRVLTEYDTGTTRRTTRRFQTRKPVRRDSSGTARTHTTQAREGKDPWLWTGGEGVRPPTCEDIGAGDSALEENNDSKWPVLLRRV